MFVYNGRGKTPYLWYSASQSHGDQGPQLHHFQQQQAEAEAESERVKEVSHGADCLAGGQQPGHHAGEGHHDAQEEEHSHALVAVESAVTHLDEHVGQHPQGDADTEYGERDDHKGPGSPDE